MCPHTAYELRSCVGRINMSLAYLLDRKAQRNGNVFKVHTYKRIAYVESRLGFDVLDRHGVGHCVIYRRRKGTARLWHWANADFVVHEFFGSRALDYKRSV